MPDKPGVLEAISYQVVGLFVVFTALGSIWLLMEGMGFVFRGVERRKKLNLALATPAVPLPAAAPTGIAPELIAVITAAAHASLQAGEHIVSIVPLERYPQPNIQ